MKPVAYLTGRVAGVCDDDEANSPLSLPSLLPMKPFSQPPEIRVQRGGVAIAVLHGVRTSAHLHCHEVIEIIRPVQDHSVPLVDQG